MNHGNDESYYLEDAVSKSRAALSEEIRRAERRIKYVVGIKVAPLKFRGFSNKRFGRGKTGKDKPPPANKSSDYSHLRLPTILTGKKQHLTLTEDHHKFWQENNASFLNLEARAQRSADVEAILDDAKYKNISSEKSHGSSRGRSKLMRPSQDQLDLDILGKKYAGKSISKRRDTSYRFAAAPVTRLDFTTTDEDVSGEFNYMEEMDKIKSAYRNKETKKPQDKHRKLLRLSSHNQASNSSFPQDIHPGDPRLGPTMGTGPGASLRYRHRLTTGQPIHGHRHQGIHRSYLSQNLRHEDWIGWFDEEADRARDELEEGFRRRKGPVAYMLKELRTVAGRHC